MPNEQKPCCSPLPWMIVIGVAMTSVIAGVLYYLTFTVQTQSETAASDNLQAVQMKSEIARLEKQLADLKAAQPAAPSEPSMVPAPLMEATTTKAVNGKKDFIWHDFRFSFPATWTLETDANNNMYFDKNNQTMAWVFCPMEATGFEGWDKSVDQTRTYIHGRQSFDAWLWLLKPTAGNEDAGWLTMIFGALNPEGVSEKSCMVKLATANPPTAAERALAEELYKSIK